MKISILLRHDADDFKGEMIAAHNRTKELIKNFPEAKIQVLVLREYFNSFYCKLRGTQKIKKNKEFCYESITYKALWFNFSPIDNILTKLHKRPIVIFKELDRFISRLKDSDIIIAHSTYAGYVALKAKQKYNIPFMVTWHGTDIHTTPIVNPYLRSLTIDIINNADANCFVSRDLMTKSESLSKASRREVLYNGVDCTKFRKYSDIEKITAHQDLHIESGVKNVAFIGNLYNVKNVLALPEVYKLVIQSFGKDNILFHFIGDGPLRKELETLCHQGGIPFRIWGNQPAELMPQFINCMDLVVLPSLNEGLPLISVETLACGVPMVGSDVGGIPEAIGRGNVVPLNDEFAQNLASLILNKLGNVGESVFVPNQFSWIRTGRIEKDLINNILMR